MMGVRNISPVKDPGVDLIWLEDGSHLVEKMENRHCNLLGCGVRGRFHQIS
jgi:hypothetical protein